MHIFTITVVDHLFLCFVLMVQYEETSDFPTYIVANITASLTVRLPISIYSLREEWCERFVSKANH